MFEISKKFFLTLCCVIAFSFCSCSKTSAFNLELPDFYGSPVTESSSGNMRYFRFTVEQQMAFSKFFEKYGDAALQLQLRATSIKTKLPTDANFEFGFLYENDFSSIKKLSSRPVISDSFLHFEENPFSLAFCAEKEKSLPSGFYIRSASKYAVEGAKIIRACIGHDFKGEVPLFAFGPNGGTTSTLDDFSGASMAFSAVNGSKSIMPSVQIDFGENREARRIAFGGESLTIRPADSIVEIPSASLKSPFSKLSFSDSAPAYVMMKAGDTGLLNFSASSRNPVAPIKVDPGLIMNWPRNNWRGNDFELFEWDRFSGVLIMDISTYAVQDDFFRRLAYFVEKAGYRGQLLTDEFLKGKHGYNAHDYRAESLADFFEKARTTDFKLNEREILLKEILVRNGVIIEGSDGSISAGKGAVISISQESQPYLRTTFIAHEGWHGIFFVDDDFRNAVASIYYTLDPDTVKYLKKYFQVTPTLNYDVNDEYLMKNEFMAYMLQRPLSQVGKYFVDMASREHSQYKAKAEADYVIRTNAEGFVSASQLLDEYVNGRWNLNAGRVWLITR
ncbi:MAG: hypothetical protein KBT11_09630 [Treponema sp.]|nr:hypothetical protein [Candidatus Treponema equifaecale]